MDTLSEDDVALLRDRSFAHVTTLNEDGSPQSSPVWVDIDDGHVLVNTTEGRAKARNVRRDPRVSLSIAHPSDPYRALMIAGRAVEITNEGAKEHIDFLANKYTGRDFGGHDPNDPRVLIRIRPERISHHG
jgi:PPOX class probable F420-dependent enzyme